MGLQEVMESQLVELQQCLPHYHIFGEKRDSVPNALYNPILVKHSPTMRVRRTGTFWLSLTPDVKGSKGNKIYSKLQFDITPILFGFPTTPLSLLLLILIYPMSSHQNVSNITNLKSFFPFLVGEFMNMT